jgi:hypothetical protein
MHSIKLQTHVGHDGLLQFKLPVGISNQDLEVIVIYQPINQTSKRAWSPQFFERTFGAWQGEPLVREAQGELPERDSLL